jgi:hypothetical protein
MAAPCGPNVEPICAPLPTLLTTSVIDCNAACPDVYAVDLPVILPNKPAVPCIMLDILSGVILAPKAQAGIFFPFFFITLMNIYKLY